MAIQNFRIMSKGKFFKMHATGKSFILIFCGNYKVEKQAEGMDSLQVLAKSLCHPNFNIGADALLAIYPPETYKFRNGETNQFYYMRVINKDGSNESMSCNGLRCFSSLLYKLELQKCQKFKVCTQIGVKDVQIREKSLNSFMACIVMGSTLNQSITQVKDKIVTICNHLTDHLYRAVSMEFTVPQIVLHVSREYGEALNPERISQVAKSLQIQYNANINFVWMSEENGQRGLWVKTFEWGSGLTLACGTGVCSSYLSSLKHNLIYSDQLTIVQTLGGVFQMSVSNQEVVMNGPAKLICSGEFEA